MSDMPPLPEGFTMDAPASSAMPPLPEGFTLDAPASAGASFDPAQAAPLNDVQRAAAARLAEHPTLDRFMTGFVQPLIGGTQLAAHVLPGVDTAGPDLAAHNAALSQKQAATNAGLKEGDTDWVNLAGNVASPINYMPGVGAVARGAGAATGIGARVAGSTLARGALQGAELAAYQPVDVQPGESYAGEKAGQVGLGAGIGSAGAKAISAVGSVVKPTFEASVQRLLDEGVKLTPGQILGGVSKRIEDIAAKVPLVGGWVRGAQGRSLESFNVAAANRALKPLEELNTQAVSHGWQPLRTSVERSVKPGYEMISHVEDQLSTGYNNVLKGMSFTPDAAFSNDILHIIQSAKQLPSPQSEAFANIVQNQIIDKMGIPNQGTVSGKELQGIMSELGRLSAGYAGDPSFDARTLGWALHDVRDVLSAGLERQNATDAPLLQSLNKGWANFVRLRQAASSTASQAREGVFTATQLGSATRLMDKTVGKSASAKGNALMQDLAVAGRKILPSQVSDSGTPERLLTMPLLGYGAMNVSPAAAVSGAVIPLLYSSAGQKFARAALTARPAGSQAVRDIIKKYAPDAAARVPLLFREKSE